MDSESTPLIPETTEKEDACAVTPAGGLNPAECMFKKLLAQIADFEERLDPDEEVGAVFVTFGGKTVYITGIGFHGNDMVVFHGVSENGKPVRVLQHVNQTNVLLTGLKRRPEHAQAKRIGFISEDLEMLGPMKTLEQ